VDVGHGQLHPGLRSDPRVLVHERVNVRHLSPAEVGGPVDVLCADLAFIYLATVAPALMGLAAPGADGVLLVKPQFEAGRAEATRGSGVIRDPAVWRRTLQRVTAAYRDQNAAIMGLMVSPLAGAGGNVEFLAHVRAGVASDTGMVGVDAVVAEAARGRG
jgi:23S rRNA (cytidine1920-2'-O)/16S rRNA (cytidine1409-2'-O)-methyltransferase